MSDGIAALGTTLAYQTAPGPPAVYSALINVKDVDAPDSEMGKADTTHLGSTIKTKRPTLLDPGTVSLTINWIPSDTHHKAIRTAFQTKAEKLWKITYSDGSFDTFGGWVSKFHPSAGGAEENLTAEVVIEVTTDIVPNDAP